MAEDLAKAAGLGRKIELTGPDGKKVEYEASPLTMGDLAAFQKYLGDCHLAAASTLIAGVPAAERYDMIRRASRETVSDKDMQQEMETFGGFRFILWRCLKKKKPDLTLEQTGELFTVRDLDKLLPVIQSISGIGDGENPTQGG